MIKDYNIKLVNNEEILYVYLDFNSEFANLNSKNNNKKLKEEIKDYLEKNNIVFKGCTVAIVVGGIMMGTLLLNKPITSKSYASLNSSGTSSIVSIIDNVDNSSNVENEHNIINNGINDDVIVKESIEDKVEETKESNKKVKKTSKIKTSTNQTNVNKSTVVNNNQSVSENTNKVEEKIEELVENSKSNLIYVTVHRSDGTVLTIELEEYIIGVVGAEMPASFNSEALKAQAVVARTYTLRALESGKRLNDNSSTQNYKTNNELKTLWGSSYNTYYNKIKTAVESTKGMYLTYGGTYIDAVYHSTSNGHTEDSKNVWGNSVPYLVSVNSSFDNSNKSYLTTTFYSYEDISKKLNNIVSNETNFNILSRNSSGRVSEIEVNGNTYTGVVFRNLLGLRSADFEIEKVDRGVNITTEGYGHGVGMSQYGANGMANNGYDFKDILLHYYTGVKLNYS